MSQLRRTCVGRAAAVLMALGLTSTGVAFQQAGDASFDPPIVAPTFAEGAGPVIAIDEAHHNFHTLEGRYAPFAQLLRRDGYLVRALATPFSAEALDGVAVLVVANAVAQRNILNWSLPTAPAFEPHEIAAVLDWVAGGGALLLIADHMPFPGAAADLAAAFGLAFHNGFAVRHADGGKDAIRGREDIASTLTFRLDDRSLREHAITRGRGPHDRVDHVTTFTGQGFRALPGVDVEPVLVLGSDVVVLLPEQAWQFSESTPRVPGHGLLQGALITPGGGRVAVFGEAAMFTAQVAGPTRRPMGMNHPDAPQNARFLLNLMRWLSGSRVDGP